MTLVLSDTIIADISALKHYTQTLRNENTEMKQSLASLAVSRYELANEVKALKGLVSQLVSQHNSFNNSLTNLTKDSKFLLKDNFQLRSKIEILQIRMKNLQGSQGKDQIQKVTSPRTEPDEKEDLMLDFPRSPKGDNIVNKNTKDRLETLKRDLQSVFQKKEGKNEPVKGEKEMIMDEWPSQSELNISQTPSEDRIQNISPVGDQIFNSRGNQGQRSSLMEQVEMLSMPATPHKEHFMYEPVLETNSNVMTLNKRDNTEMRNVYNSEGLGTHRDNIIAVSGILQSSGVTLMSSQPQNVTRREGVEILNRNMLEDHKLSAVKSSARADISHMTKSAAPNSYTFSTTAGVTQNSLSSSEAPSMYPIYNTKPEEHHQKFEYTSPGNYQSYGYAPLGGFGGADAKIKRELYTQAENMLVNVLDKLEENPHRIGTDPFYIDSDMYRYHNKPQLDLGQGHHGVGYELQDPEKVQVNANDVSTTLSSSSRGGTKRLKLFKKGIKSKEEFSGQKDVGTSGNVSYGNQR